MKYIQVQQKLQNRVFNNSNLAKSIEVQNYSLIENAYGEQILEFNFQEVHNGIVLNYTKHHKKYDADGLYNDSSFILLLPHNTDINENSVISFDTKEFEIIQIDKQPFGDGFTHITLFLKNKV